MLRCSHFSSVFGAGCSFPVSFAWFALCSQILWSLSSGLLLALKFCSLFRTVCSLFSYSFRVFRLCKLVRTGLLLVLRFSNFFRAVCFLFSDSLFFGAVCSRDFENKEHTAQKWRGNFRTRSKPLQRAGKRNKPFQRDERMCEQRAHGSEGTGEFLNKGQTARKGLASLRAKSKPSERDQRL